MKRGHRPEIGTEMYFVAERLYYVKSVQAAPFLEYCVCEGAVWKYIDQNQTEMCLIYDGSLSYFKLAAIGEKVFYTPREAALLAKKKTEKYERVWGWLGDPLLRRTWAYLLEGDKSLGTRFHAPEGCLTSNIGLLAGTVIRELRLHPYVDRELEGCQWNHKPEYLEFTILSIQESSYTCQYSGEKETFFWGQWKKQPNYGFLGKNSGTQVRYYIQDAPIPSPYESKAASLSPFCRRCNEIDSAALLIKDPEAFAALAAEPEASTQDFGTFLERPNKKFLATGGCPYYRGKLNYGNGTNILCDAVRQQLHDYVSIKFCEDGRKIYCPIWRAKNKSQIVSKSDTEEGLSCES